LRMLTLLIHMKCAL